jgi:hypothetical protein
MVYRYSNSNPGFIFPSNHIHIASLPGDKPLSVQLVRALPNDGDCSSNPLAVIRDAVLRHRNNTSFQLDYDTVTRSSRLVLHSAVVKTSDTLTSISPVFQKIVVFIFKQKRR